ncbi:MAG TPA: PilN domain-containing protein [Blastocatellia bacterium]|nr:PilN domain-containing protein [Blastocatellia bacterium]
MIRVNLLEGTAEHRVAVQKTKVAARRGQQLFMVAAALVIFLVALAVDHLWTTNAHAEAQTQLDHEQEVAKKLEADVQRKNELEAELKQVEERIKVIKQLRAEQKGPVAMMSAINERMPGGLADFRLDQITQKGTHLQIVGTSVNQQVIADFARQLEFSNGLFSNLVPTIESTEVKSDDLADRKQADNAADKKDSKDAKKDAKKDNDKAEGETARIFRFTIDCDYNKPRAEDSKDGKATPPQPGK